ncbi:MAG: sugar phosphate isomerase/epimerase [Planctomycetota bacterium]
MNEVSLGCSDLAWGPTGFVEAISAISEIGYDGIECSSDLVQEYEDRLHVFEEIMDTSHLKLCAMSQAADFLDRENADAVVERVANTARFLSANRTPCLVVSPRNPANEAMANDDWVTVAAVLDEMGVRCREFGVKLAFRPRAGFLAGGSRDLARLLEMSNKTLVFLCCDTAELELAKIRVPTFLKKWKERVAYVRYRDISGAKRRKKTTSNESGRAPLFGRGAVSFARVGKALLQAGYNGWVTVEIAGESHPPREAAMNAFRYVVRKGGLFA